MTDLASTRLSTSKVLCAVEDDPDMRLLIRAMLRVDTRLVIAGEADSLESALAEVARHRPDLIILDHFIHGSVMGLQAAPLLRAAAPTAKILLFTSHDLAVEAAREPAIDSYLRKGDIDQLLAVIHDLLGLEDGTSHSMH